MASRSLPEYEPDSDLRDTEQVPLLEDGGIEAFVRREVLPYVPDAWVDEGRYQDWVRDFVYALLLQTAATAHAGGDSRRHRGDRAGHGRPSG